MKTTVNFRDLGGLRGFGGKTIDCGRLYRGGQLFEMSDSEKHAFCEHYDIRTIIDLRNEESFSIKPNGQIPGVDQHIFQVMMDMEELSKANPMRDSNLEAAAAYLTAVYAEFVTNCHACGCFRDILELMAGQEQGGIYFHCFAGKDRTGVVAAILLSLLGVCRRDILLDYLKTQEGRAAENKRLLDIARRKGKTEDELGAMAVFYTVEARYLESFFAAAEQHYGCFERYVTDGIGISAEQTEQLRYQYLT